MARNGIGKLEEDLAVTNARVNRLETAVERGNQRLEELVERKFDELRDDMTRWLAALTDEIQKKTLNSPPTSEPMPSTSSD